MDNADTRQRILDNYPIFRALSDAELTDLLRAASPTRLPAGSVLFEEHKPCRGFPMLLEGSVRVVKTAPSGRELQLYRVTPGESCILTSSCLLGSVPYSARGIAETDLQMVVLPPPLFNRLVAMYEPFRGYVFSLFSERLAELMQLIEEVAFRKLDQRLAALLLAKGKIVRATHQALADELGSVREIISRLLKSFAEQGLVSLGREQIEVLDPAALKRVADGAR